MNSFLQNFDSLLPLAVEWAASQEKYILAHGQPLTKQGIDDAKQMGVSFPHQIRLLQVEKVPIPENPLLFEAAKTTGLISPHTGGMAIRYGIFIRHDCWNERALIAHECVHTGQYERLGGIEAFLKQYLKECIEIGYPEAPLEQEAIEKSTEILEKGK